jgi:hypothetical protein
MNKILTVFLCVLGLAVACIPAYANPTNKKITLTCASVTGDSVTGSATVTLCETTNCGSVVGDDSITCLPVTCDSTSTVSMTNVCSTDAATVPFKVGAVSVNTCYHEDEDSQDVEHCTPHPGTGGGIAVTGKGFFTVVGPGTDSDTVSLTVK